LPKFLYLDCKLVGGVQTLLLYPSLTELLVTYYRSWLSTGRVQSAISTGSLVISSKSQRWLSAACLSRIHFIVRVTQWQKGSNLVAGKR